MTLSHRIGLISDPHYHHPGRRTTRPFTDTLGSTRIYNESASALIAALDLLAARDIRIVLIAGDLTDDGQKADLAGARSLLSRYEERHGMRFFMTPGNHDMFGMKGRHRTQRYLLEDGSSEMRSSDPVRADCVYDPDLLLLGYPQAMLLLHGLGFTPDPRDRHWESPFGKNPDPCARTFLMKTAHGAHEQIESSYLVEPEDGLWLLSLDANVFRPAAAVPGDGAQAVEAPPRADGALENLSDPNRGGWAHVLRHKPWLIEWVADVVRRAEALGKTLIAFSHYPVLEPTDRILQDDTPLLGRASHPDPGRAAAAEAVRRTGLTRIFTGHIHADERLHLDGGHGLVNEALPGLVSFPAAVKILEKDGTLVTVPVVDTDFKSFRSAYAGETQALPDHPLLQAGSYAEFLERHFEAHLEWRYFAREWPADTLSELDRGDITDLIPGIVGGPLDIPARVVAQDWYKLRKGGPIEPRRLALYRGQFGDDVLSGLTSAIMSFGNRCKPA